MKGARIMRIANSVRAWAPNGDGERQGCAPECAPPPNLRKDDTGREEQNR